MPNPGLSARLFLYREMLEVHLPWLDDIVRAQRPAGCRSSSPVTRSGRCSSGWRAPRLPSAGGRAE
jgi:hypothetical protein